MSEYLKKLQQEYPDAAKRYRDKLFVIDCIDPYTLKENSLSYDPSKFPPVSSMDIVSYLVLTTSYYTKEQMKAYKSLQAFKYFEAGFVNKCGSIKIKEHVVIIAKVKHSKRMNEPPVDVWTIIKEDGSILTAHCTCMAGIGEVCSHVGAVLYSLEYINTSRSSTSCTDVRAMWKVPTTSRVECQQIKNIDFGRSVASGSKVERAIPIQQADIGSVLQDFKEVGAACGLMRVVEPFSNECAKAENILPNIFSELYSEEYEEMEYEDFIKIYSHNIKIILTEEDCYKIRNGTTGQRNNKAWFEQRKGRITASILKQVCKTKIDKPSLSLLKKICYPLQDRIRSKPIEWGINHEQEALEAYRSQQNLTHHDLTLEQVGFFVLPEYPQLGASPDSLVKCQCCGVGSVEIKCPYLLKDRSLEDFSNLKGSCLIKGDDGGFELDKEHSYFYQIQQQMALTKTTFCDFVIWSPKEIFIQRVPFNEDFWTIKSEIAIQFHKNVVVPELLGRYFTRTKMPFEICICNSSREMPKIKCNSDSCEIEWFHLQCVGLSDIPDLIWYCSNCDNKSS